MKDQDEQDVARRLTARIRADAAAELPPPIATRLAAARREAVAAMRHPARSAHGHRLAWAGLGAAATAVLALVVGLRDESAHAPLPYLEAQEFAAAQELELLEDLEFLAWLETEESDGAG